MTHIMLHKCGEYHAPSGGYEWVEDWLVKVSQIREARTHSRKTFPKTEASRTYDEARKHIGEEAEHYDTGLVTVEENKEIRVVETAAQVAALIKAQK